MDSNKKSELIMNASTPPRIFYGLHMAQGVAEYRNPKQNGGKPYRLMIGEDAIKNMDPTFAGCPVFVSHVTDVDGWTAGRDENGNEVEPDGWVTESFYNSYDGKHWAKFIVTTDRGHEAIRSGWKLSNAYFPESKAPGGLWHGVEYLNEVVKGKYEHLAIVPNPRYSESVILTPEEFKAYNSKKDLELKALANSNEQGEKPMLKFFKKAKVDNSADLEGMSVELPKSKKEFTIAELVANADSNMMSGCYANGDHKVKVGDEEMTVNELVAKHMAMKNKAPGDQADADAHIAEAAGEGELPPTQGEVGKEKMAMNDEDEKMKAEKMAKEKKENEEKAEKEKTQNAADAAAKKANFEKLANAEADAKKKAPTIDLSQDKVARGKSRYGSKA